MSIFRMRVLTGGLLDSRINTVAITGRLKERQLGCVYV